MDKRIHQMSSKEYLAFIATHKNPDSEILKPGKRKKATYTEDDLQANCIKAFRQLYPKLRGRFFAIPNGGSRNVIEAAKLKRTGTTAGVPDLFLSIPCGNYGGAFIEMKLPGKHVSEHQAKFIATHQADYYCVVCFTVTQFLEEVKNYLNGS